MLPGDGGGGRDGSGDGGMIVPRRIGWQCIFQFRRANQLSNCTTSYN